ncbi:MAG TPA: isoprenylcysteine carboxylmethyltransferase family protein [Candidatus Limnocylindrales bacterium]
MSRYAQWSRTEHGERTRIGVTLLAGPVFLCVLPILVAVAGPRLDRRLGLKLPRIGPLGRLLGRAVSAAGFSLGIWTVATQLDRGRGTPLPVMPTQELLTDGPYRYCRNPMTLGAILAYLGIAIASRTISGGALVVALAAILLAYLRRLEEPELAERFGEAYLAYRRETPFIVPGRPRRR